MVINMKEKELLDLLQEVQPLDIKAMEESQRRWNAIAHPLHSLGKLEDFIIQVAGITGDATMHLEKKALIVMCADNGVVAEGVTQTGQEVTAIVSENFLTKEASAAIMCQIAKADIFPVDIGIARDTNIIDRKIAYGTKNMVNEPAMTREQVMAAITVGIEMVKELKEKGYGMIATGEMGIGNTTTSSAITAVLLEQSVEKVTGVGAGLSKDGLERKINAIKKAIALHQPDKDDCIDVLSKVGGFDIAGLVGVFLGGAIYRVPIVIDGFISGVAALCAVRLCNGAKEYMIASHISKEPATKMVLAEIEANPFLDCDMHLGEGTGAVTTFPILTMGCAVYQGMTTFEKEDIDTYEEYETNLE